MDETTEVFRQAVTSTMRAISGNDELSVTFGRGKPFMHGNKARIPIPELGVSEAGLAALRGTADRFALRTRYHDEQSHAEARPAAGGGPGAIRCGRGNPDSGGGVVFDARRPR